MEPAGKGSSFAELDEYYLFNGGSHLKPPARIGAPALSWHTALWIPALGKDTSFEAHRATWLESVDWFLASFARTAYDVWKSDRPADAAEAERLRPHAFTEASRSSSQVTLFRHRVKLEPDAQAGVMKFDRLDEREIDQYRNELVSFKFFFHGIPMKLRASLHNEIVALTFIAELNFGHAPGSDATIPEALQQHFSRIAEAIKPRVEALSSGTRNERHDSDTEPHENFKLQNALAASSSYLYNGFWKAVWDVYGSCLQPAFDIDIYRKERGGTPALYAKRVRSGRAGLEAAIGLTFGDFRSVVLAGEMTKSETVLHWEIDRPFPERVKAQAGIPLHQLSNSDALALTDALVPLLEAAEVETPEPAPAVQVALPKRVAPGQAGSFRMGHEHTAARFLGGRALYLSSLAAHQRWRVLDGGHEPLRFLIVAPRENRWQLGRLIERLHLLGTLRLASLKDLIALNAAGEELHTFGLTLDSVEQMTNSEQRSKASQRKRRGPAFDGGQNPDHEIDLNARLSEINASCDGGVLYRVERSRYYTATFAELAKLLRIVRIEGYQPYDEFVYRRLGSTWDSIDRLGNRMERARRRVDSINASLQVHEQQMQTREQTKLLEFAELAAVIPIGYYGGHILMSIVAGLIAFFHEPGAEPFRPESLDAYLGGASLLVMVLYYYIVLPYLKARRERRDAAARERA